MARSAKAVPAQRRNFFHKMQLKMFSIPALDPGEGTEEMNRFLRAHRVLSVEKRLVGADAAAFWSVCVEYLDRAYGAAAEAGNSGQAKAKVDYKEVLNAEDFAVFARLREVRKAVSEREAVPPYTVFTNEQLAAMVTQRVDSLAALGRIDGIGPARIEKYGALFLGTMKAAPAAKQEVAA